MSALLVITFIALLLSAYTQYTTNMSIAGLVDASSSLANHVALKTLAYEEGEYTKEYVVDLQKIPLLDFRQEIGGENFMFQVTIRYTAGAEQVLGPYGPLPPSEGAVSSISVPVTVFDNYRFETGKLEAKVWRA